MTKENTITLKLTNREVRRLVELLYKGNSYNGCFCSDTMGKKDWEFTSKIQQMLVDGSDKYKDKNIKVHVFNGRLSNEATGKPLF